MWSRRSARENDANIAINVQDESDELNLSSTFRNMASRRLRRRYRGVYKKGNIWHAILVFIILAYSFGAVSLSGNQVSVNDSDWGDSLFSAFLIVLFAVLQILVVVRVALVVRWMIYILVLASVTSFALTGSNAGFFVITEDENKDHFREISLYTIRTLFYVLEGFVVCTYVVTHYVYPWMINRGTLNALQWWNVRATEHRNRYSYLSKIRFYTTARDFISYHGGLDDHDRPHGFGRWEDTNFHGEILCGYFEHGKAIAPFRSREAGTGYTFTAIRIAYVHNRGESDFSKSDFFPSFSNDGLQWGVASVECSVSGSFFMDYPLVEGIIGPESDRSAAWCTDAVLTKVDTLVMRSPEYNLVITSDCEKFYVSGHEPTEHASQIRLEIERCHDACANTKTNSMPLKVNGWSSTACDTKEALVFFPGFNCPVEYAIKRFGQLLALGDFPSSLVPFVFGWPTGTALTYFQALSKGAASQRTQGDFVDFMSSLKDAGYQSVNFIVHSMGARVLFNAISSSSFGDIFRPTNQCLETMDHRIKLSAVVLLNPDFELSKFVADNGGFDQLRSFCDHITMYGDRTDGALWYAEQFSRKTLFGEVEKSLGRNLYDLGRYRSANTPKSSGHIPCIDASTTSPLDYTCGTIQGTKKFVSSLDGVSRFIGDSIADYTTSRASDDKQFEYLDMDVLDTTYMDNNVHSMRHNYFNTNPTLVDDLRLVLVDKLRAKDRAGIYLTEGNVHTFLVAPSYIQND